MTNPLTTLTAPPKIDASTPITRSGQVMTGARPGNDKVMTGSSKLPWTATWILLFCLSSVITTILVPALHANHGFFVPTLATAICILAALFDAWTTRIPNPLTYTAILIGLALNTLSALTPQSSTLHLWLAAPGIQQSLLGFAVCAILGLVGLLIANVGGGDIKLLAALGALLGLSDIGYVLILALSVALAYALLNLALLGRLNAAARIAAMRTLELLYLRQLPNPADSSADPEKPRIRDTIPMAIPLALALLLSQLCNLQKLFGGGS